MFLKKKEGKVVPDTTQFETDDESLDYDKEVELKRNLKQLKKKSNTPAEEILPAPKTKRT